jgi:hypothetical protein
MKNIKKTFFLFVTICSLSITSVFAQSKPIPCARITGNKGQELNALVDGNVIYSESNTKKIEKSKMEIPEGFRNGTLLLEYEEKYYLDGQEVCKKFQLLYSGFTPDDSFKKASEKKSIGVKGGTKIGIAGDAILLTIRTKELDPHLLICSGSEPVYYGSYWYYGLESFMNSTPKFLTFKQLSSSEDSITVTAESTLTLKEIAGFQTFMYFPAPEIAFKAKMNTFPFPKHELTSQAEKVVHQNLLEDETLELIVEFDGIKIHLYFPEQFDDYFRKEVKWGEDVYFYGNIVYSEAGEVHVYGRDFMTKDIKDVLQNKKITALLKNGFDINDMLREESQGESNLEK